MKSAKSNGCIVLRRVFGIRVRVRVNVSKPYTLTLRCIHVAGVTAVVVSLDGSRVRSYEGAIGGS